MIDTQEHKVRMSARDMQHKHKAQASSFSPFLSLSLSFSLSLFLFALQYSRSSVSLTFNLVFLFRQLCISLSFFFLIPSIATILVYDRAQKRNIHMDPK